MRSRYRLGALLPGVLLFTACPTRTIYYPDGGTGGSAGSAGQSGGAGGSAGTSGAGGVAGAPIAGAGGQGGSAGAGTTCAGCEPGISCSATAGICLGCGPGAALTEASAGLNGQTGDQFGSAIALRNGSLLVAVSPSNSGSQTVLAFSVSGSSFSFLQPIAPPVGTSYSSYAQGVAIDGLGNTAVVAGSVGGAPTQWVFAKTGVSWFPGASFSPTQAGSISIDRGTVLVGGGYSAYTYSTSGTMLQTLDAPDFTPGAQTGAFGAPAVISGDTLLVTGEPEDSSFNLGHFGYVFVRSGSDWVQQGKLIPSDLPASSGPHFQFSAALDGSTAVMATTSGAYVFTRAGTAWSQVQKLPPPANAPAFGSSVALSGDALVIGGNTYVGVPSAAYFYGRSNGSWTLGATLSSGSRDANTDGFGQSVATSAGTVAVSAPFGSSGGAVYLFSCQPNQ